MIKKSLGQHWLSDRQVLGSIADAADIVDSDVILEIGPGLGTLTSILLGRAKKVIAVELDDQLAANLPAQFPGTQLVVVHDDILQFNLSDLPAGYKVVANVPYYITGKILRMLMSSTNRPSVIVLLVQKEVAERLAAGPGNMSILAISAQLNAEVLLGDVVPAHMFTPPPKVDSQVVIIRPRSTMPEDTINEKLFFQLVRAGFSAKRKKLRSSLAGGLGIDKSIVEQLLYSSDISSDARAEVLSISEWKKLTDTYEKLLDSK